MKLLAFSDIHDNLVAVCKMRAAEPNSFDAIVVAGDIGNGCTEEFFKILSTFRCPVLYVFGNWDHKLSYKKSYRKDCNLIHLNIIQSGKYFFAGFSGCPTNWGRNPIARKLQRDPQAGSVEPLEQNRKELSDLIAKADIDPRRTIVVTHERLGHLRHAVPSALLHLFGHIHKFSEHDFMGTRYVNVAALDRQVSARRRNKENWKISDCRNFNAGNYTIVEINAANDLAVQCVYLRREYKNWIAIDRRLNGIDWIPEERRWMNRSDPPLLRYEVWPIAPSLPLDRPRRL